MADLQHPKIGGGELWRSGRTIPWFHIGSVFDADADSAEAKALYELPSAEGWESTLNFQSKTHEYTVVYDSLTRIFDWFDRHRRVENPAQVTYALPPEEDASLGLQHDGAFWLSGMVGEPGAWADVETFGIAHAPVDPVASIRSAREVNEGRCTGGDTSAELLETVPVFGAPAPVANRAIVKTRGLSAMTLDIDRMGLRLASISLEVDTDQPLTVTLVSGTRTRLLEF